MSSWLDLAGPVIRGCGAAFVGAFPRRIYRWITEIAGDVEVLWRHSELHECYIAFLFAAYSASAMVRLSRYEPPRQPA